MSSSKPSMPRGRVRGPPRPRTLAFGELSRRRHRATETCCRTNSSSVIQGQRLVRQRAAGKGARRRVDASSLAAVTSQPGKRHHHSLTFPSDLESCERQIRRICGAPSARSRKSFATDGCGRDNTHEHRYFPVYPKQCLKIVILSHYLMTITA